MTRKVETNADGDVTLDVRGTFDPAEAVAIAADVLRASTRIADRLADAGIFARLRRAEELVDDHEAALDRVAALEAALERAQEEASGG